MNIKSASTDIAMSCNYFAKEILTFFSVLFRVLLLSAGYAALKMCVSVNEPDTLFVIVRLINELMDKPGQLRDDQ